MYFITTIDPKDNDVRCVGYFSDKNIAIEVVENNIGDIYEAGCYQYAVIEHIPEGIYQYDTEPLWFTYVEKAQKYQPCATPLFIRKEHMVGFAIG
jgi:hypothetical protein